MRTFVDRRVLASVVLGLLMITAGCSGGGGGGGDAASGDPGAAVTPDASQERSGSESDSLQVQQRAVIRTGQVSVRVESFDAAERNLTRAVSRYGGFVSDSSVEVHRVDNATYKSGTLVLRVPQDDFSAMMAHARSVGELRSSSTQSEDVTDQLVDIEARLENLRAERDRLRQLYRNATDTEEVLAVEERLSEVQGEIERLEARKEGLERRVALSTIRVELHEPRPEPGPIDTDRWYDTPLVAAFLDSVNGVLVTLRAIVVAGAYVVPYLLVFGVPVVGLAYGVSRLRRRRREADAGSATDEETTDDTDESETDAERESEEARSDATDRSEEASDDAASADDGDE